VTQPQAKPPAIILRSAVLSFPQHIDVNWLLFLFRKRDEGEMRKKPEKRLQLRCPSCGGTGFPVVMQPTQPGRKIYPAPCKQCEGKGWIKQPNNEKTG
jgi:hypothetical protein